jgi:peptidoglycan/xylan/chitin deacetylase (PgdA/CDA1 family)
MNWPEGADVAVSLTFDVDAESGSLGEGEANRSRLSTLSEGRYSVTRGVPRILDVLQRTGVKGTFYIPGWTAENHADALQDILAAGHEIGHHGYLHLRSDAISAQAQREEIEHGTAALEDAFGVTPRGYRSPSWEITPETLGLLLEKGFAWDSSLMGDDRPYMVENMVELPVHWSLDDWPHLHWRPGRGDSFTSPSDFLETWLAEFDSALAERRHVTYTMHPEVIGRGYRAALLERLIDEMGSRGKVWFATHGDVSGWVRDDSSV